LPSTSNSVIISIFGSLRIVKGAAFVVVGDYLYILSTITFLLLVHIKNSDNNREKCFVLDTYGINLENDTNRS
jgi:hypothetical protein